MTTEEKIFVMNAHLRGEKIEAAAKVDDNLLWEDCEDPQWNWGMAVYRVKETEKYRAYETVEELLEDMKIHGHYVKEGNVYRFIKKFTVCNNGEIAYTLSGWSSTSVHTWEAIHDKIVWADGTPFGRINLGKAKNE